MGGKHDPPLDPQGAHPLASDCFDETQVMLMKSALQGSLNAKSAFSLWVESVKQDLKFSCHPILS
jgi:hypothetical protein